MDKREYELGKLAFKARIADSICGLIRILLVCTTVVISIKFILDGIKPLVGQNADQINALAKFVQSFHLGSIFGYVLAGITGCAWAVERRGKQRAIQQKAQYQQLAEKDEPNRSSSGLTSIGQTPK